MVITCWQFSRTWQCFKYPGENMQWFKLISWYSGAGWFTRVHSWFGGILWLHRSHRKYQIGKYISSCVDNVTIATMKTWSVYVEETVLWKFVNSSDLNLFWQWKLWGKIAVIQQKMALDYTLSGFNVLVILKHINYNTLR